MTESKFTKGPWRYGDGGIFGPWDDEKDCNPLIAYVRNAGMNGPQTQEGYANGQLIASAWELYEALSGMMAAMKTNDVDAMARFMTIGIDALAKAEGRS